MLSFDIETEGLDSKVHAITVACVYDPDAGIKRAFNLKLGGGGGGVPDGGGGGDAVKEAAEEFMRHLDDAPTLCSFNGARFDIPFIVARCGAPHVIAGPDPALKSHHESRARNRAQVRCPTRAVRRVVLQAVRLL